MSKTKRIIAAVTAAIITATSYAAISVSAEDNGGSDYGFVSSSVSAQTDKNEAAVSNAQLYDKLGQLLKQGDSLKYGEALYTTGTPDGEKWTKDFYEQRVDFYGEEFLAKYIANGEFLRDKVVSDMEELTTKENNSGLKEISEDINEYMRSNGISGFTYVREVDGVEKIFISYDGFYEKIKAYVVDTGVDESLVVYQQSQDYVMVSEKSVKEFTFDEVNTMSTEEVVTLFAEKGLTKDNGYFVYGQGDEAEYIYTSTWNIHLFAEDYLIDKTVEEIITDYPPYQNGSCIYDKGESLWDSDRIVSSLALPEEYFEVTVFKNRVIVKGADSTDKYKIACNCEIRCKLPEGQECASVRNAALNYLQLREDFDEMVVDDAVPYYGKEKTAAQKYGDVIAEYMAKNSIQGVVSRSVPDEKLSIGFHGDYEDQVRAYIAEIGLDESDIPYEVEKLPDFMGFDLDNTTVTTVNEPTEVTTTTTSITTLPSVLKGDANCDEQVDLADAVMIMQSLANPNKYGIDGTAEHHLTEQGKLNGDMNGDGLTVGDAQLIQRKLLGIIEVAEADTKTAEFQFESTVDWHCHDTKSYFWESCSGNGCDAVISDTEELKAYLAEFYNEETITYYLEKYDDSFFENNVLLLDSINQPAGGEVGFKVDNVEFSDDEIYVSVKNTINGGEEVITLCLAQISVPKEAYDRQNVNWNVSYSPIAVS